MATRRASKRLMRGGSSSQQIAQAEEEVAENPTPQKELQAITGGPTSSSEDDEALSVDDVEEIHPSSSGSTKRRRGRTLALNIWGRDASNKIHLSFDKQGLVVGTRSKSWSTFVGSVARRGDILPLHYSDWRDVPSTCKDKAWEEIKKRFVIDECRKKMALDQISRSWRNFKHYVKKKLKDLETNEEKMAAKPDEINAEDWQALLDYWASEDFQEKSLINTANRAKNKIVYKGGSKSSARLREEMVVLRRASKQLPRGGSISLPTREIEEEGPTNPIPLEDPQALKEDTSSSEFEDESQSENGGSSKRRRGRTLALDIWGRDASNRIPLSFDEHGFVVGHTSKKWSTFIGSVARRGDIIPFHYSDWRSVPSTCKDKAWEEIKKRFVIDEFRRNMALDQINRRWKSFKHTAKKKLKNLKSQAEKMSAKPDEISEEDWRALLDYWETEAFQEKSLKNTANRAKNKIKHTGGSRSNARLREEMMKEKPDGPPPSMLDIWIRTHTKKDGSPVDPISASLIEKLNAAAQDQSSKTVDSAARDEILARVLGRDTPGRVCALGSTLAPSNVCGASGGPPVEETERRVDSATQQRVEALEARLRQLESSVSEEFSWMRTVMAEQLNLVVMLIRQLGENNLINVNAFQGLGAGFANERSPDPNRSNSGEGGGGNGSGR